MHTSKDEIKISNTSKGITSVAIGSQERGVFDHEVLTFLAIWRASNGLLVNKRSTKSSFTRADKEEQEKSISRDGASDFSQVPKE